MAKSHFKLFILFISDLDKLWIIIMSYLEINFTVIIMWMDLVVITRLNNCFNIYHKRYRLKLLWKTFFLLLPFGKIHTYIFTQDKLFISFENNYFPTQKHGDFTLKNENRCAYKKCWIFHISIKLHLNKINFTFKTFKRFSSTNGLSF